MKNIFSLWLCQTLLILFLNHITICYAVDLSESDNYGRSNYEEPNSNNRRGYYGDPDNVSRANQYYETAYTDGERRASQQEYFGRTGSGTKFTKSANLRKPVYPESRKAYAAALGYSNKRNGDTSEIDSAMAGASSAENGDSNGSIIHEGGLANNTAFAGVSALVKSNFPKQSQLLGKTDSCSCQGAANEEVSFLCFSSRDGKNLSIKYKGTILFDIEDIIRGYKFYFENMQVHNFNIENILNSESNFKHEFEGDSNLNVDISKFKINEGNLNFNAESKFDINKIKKGDSKFKVNTFDKFDVNTIKEDSNKFNFEITKNGGLDIQKYLIDNNNFKTQFEKNTNSNSKMEAWKKIQEMAESKTNSQFSLNNNFNSNQFSYEVDVQADAQAEIEAHAKALAEAKAKAQAIFKAQVEAEAKAHAVLQNQIVAQAHLEAEAKARAQAKAQAEAQAKTQMQNNGIGQTQINSQSQSHAISFSDSNKGHLNNYVNLGVGGEKKIFGNGGFSLGFNGAIGGSNFGTSYGKQTGGAFSFGGGAGGGIGIGGGAGAAIGIGGGAGGAIGIGGGAGGAIGIGGRVPFTGKSMVGGNDGQGMGAVMAAYSGSEFNYGDDLYDESLDDGSLSTGYSGILAFPSSNDGGRLYNNGRIQKDGYSAFGVSGYQRYP